MNTDTALLLVMLLFTKHFFIDFPMQTPYQWMNKGTYGHPGGILHAWLHGVGTCAVLSLFVPFHLALLAGVADTVIHYHIDWAKMNINKANGWKADTHPEFWTLLGLDQLLHALTYIWIVWSLV